MSTRIKCSPLLPVFLALAFTACSHGGTSPATQSKSSFIVGGAPEAGYAAVGALITDGEAFCTGTLIEPQVVVTAAHCLDDMRANQVSYFVGNDATRLGSGTLLRATAIIQHPQWRGGDNDPDVGVVLLAAAAPGVQPIALNTQVLGNETVGRSPLFVGYGITRANRDDVGIKRSVRIRVSELMAGEFAYSQPGKNTCNGDSGGPALLEIGGVTKLIGVTSYGDEDCVEYGVNTRVDIHADFIRRGQVTNEGENDNDGEADEDEDWDDDEDEGSFDDEDCEDGHGGAHEHGDDEGNFDDEEEGNFDEEEGFDDEEEEEGDFEDDEEWGEEDGDSCEEEGW